MRSKFSIFTRNFLLSTRNYSQKPLKPPCTICPEELDFRDGEGSETRVIEKESNEEEKEKEEENRKN